MKKLSALLVMLLIVGGSLLAQGNSNNSNGHSAGSWPSYVTEWIANGGEIPNQLAMRVLNEARDWGQQRGMNFGQMVSRYRQGSLQIALISIGTQNGVLTFTVSADGGITAVDILSGL